MSIRGVDWLGSAFRQRQARRLPTGFKPSSAVVNIFSNIQYFPEKLNNVPSIVASASRVLWKQRSNSAVLFPRAVKAAALASAVPILVSTKATGLTVNSAPSDTEEDNAEDEASTAPNAQSAREAAAVAETPSLVNRVNKMPADQEAQTGELFE